MSDTHHRACIKGFRQRDREIDRLRARITELEAENLQYRHELAVQWRDWDEAGELLAQIQATEEDS